MNTGSGMNTTLQRKLKKVLEIRTDTPEMLQSLETLSTFYHDNSVQARRGLRSTIERRGLAINKEFLESFKGVQEKLEQVDQEVKGLQDCCDRMTGRLQKARSSTELLLAQSERLREERQHTQGRKEIARAFLQHFELSKEEEAILTSPAGAESDSKALLAALRRVHEIHESSKLLLHTRHQNAGLQMMNLMASHQERAYEKLYRWVQAQCQLLEGESPECVPLLREGVASLRERPTLFDYCLKEVATTRRNTLHQRFLTALTVGGPGGVPRPIEKSAHDPHRFVGDMLAWLHQAVASERELLTSLFVFNSDPPPGPPLASPNPHSPHHSSTLPITNEVGESLCVVFETICRPFQSRVDQVLTSGPATTTLLRLAHLLHFYAGTIATLFPSNVECPLVTCLWDSQAASYTQFYTALRLQLERTTASPPPCPPDLSLPQVLVEALGSLSDMLSIHESSLVPVEEKEEQCGRLLDQCIEPLLTMCMHSTNHKNMAMSLTASDKAVFMANCIEGIQKVLSPHALAGQRADQLNTHIREMLDTLVEEETHMFWQKCGLASKMAALATAKEQPHLPMATIPGLDQSSMATVLRAFYAVLFDMGATLVPQCDRLVSTPLRQAANQRIAHGIAATYKHVWASMRAEGSGYTSLDEILIYSSDQVNTMLDVEGEDVIASHS